MKQPQAIQSTMRLELYRELPANEEFRRQWNELVPRTEQPEVFYTWEWAAAITRSYQTIRPLFFAAFREATLVGVVAFEESNCLTFLTARTADYCDFVSSPGDRREFVELVLLRLAAQQISSLKLSNIPASSGTVRHFKSLTVTHGYAQFSRHAYDCAHINLFSPEQRAEAAAAARNSPKRKARLSRLGEIAIEHHTDWCSFAKEFPDFVNAHIARFRSQGKSSSLAEPERRRFVEELGKLLSAQGSLRCSVLRLSGRAVAWHFGMAFHGKWFWYQPAFDLEFDHASPGTFLLREVIRDAARSTEISAIDLGLGDEGYKNRYSNSVLRTLHFTLDLSRLRLAREMSRYHLAEAVKRFPKVEKMARAAAVRTLALSRFGTKERRTASQQLSNEYGD